MAKKHTGGPPRQQAARTLDRQTFFRRHCPAKTRAWIGAAAVMCYASAAVSAYYAATSSLPAMFADATICLALGLLIHIRRSLAAAWALCLYAVASTCFYLFTSGTLTGLLPVAAAFIAMRQLTHLNALWLRYQENGSLPQS